LDAATWVAGVQLARCLNDRGRTFRRSTEALTVLPDQSLSTSLTVHATLPSAGVAPGTDHAEILVPLFAVTKRRLGARVRLGVVSSGDHELPLLSEAETDRAAAAAVLAMVDETVRSLLGEKLWRQVYDVVASRTPVTDSAVTDALELAGQHAARGWLELLGAHRLVVAVAPGEYAQRHQVIACTYAQSSWTPDETAGDRWDRVRAGWGRGTFRLAVPQVACVQTAVDHRVHEPTLPDGLVCVRSEQVTHRTAADLQPWPATVLHLSFDRGGPLTAMRWSAIASAVVLGAVATVPGALSVWRDGSGGAGALLLAVPALLLVLFARPGGGTFLTRCTRPLRGMTIALATVLALAAVSLVGELRDPWMGWSWYALALAGALLALLPGTLPGTSPATSPGRPPGRLPGIGRSAAPSRKVSS
jgi:hypothetical protein